MVRAPTPLDPDALCEHRSATPGPSAGLGGQTITSPAPQDTTQIGTAARSELAHPSTTPVPTSVVSDTDRREATSPADEPTDAPAPSRETYEPLKRAGIRALGEHTPETTAPASGQPNAMTPDSTLPVPDASPSARVPVVPEGSAAQPKPAPAEAPQPEPMQVDRAPDAAAPGLHPTERWAPDAQGVLQFHSLQDLLDFAIALLDGDFTRNKAALGVSTISLAPGMSFRERRTPPGAISLQPPPFPREREAPSQQQAQHRMFTAASREGAWQVPSVDPVEGTVLSAQDFYRVAAG